jgi:hypothetical protein
MNTNNNKTVAETGLATIDNDDIHSLIHTVRGLQVMLDSDVAKLYGYETRRVNEASNNNVERFPGSFRFCITEQEYAEIDMWSKISTTSKRRKDNLPFVYTEQGIAMLAGILKSKIAIEISIKIIETFVEMRKYIASIGSNELRLSHLENEWMKYKPKMIKVFDAFQNDEFPQEKLFFKDKYFDAYKFVIKLIKTAKSNIIVIDNYLNNSILDIFSHTEKSIEKSIITTSKCKIDKSAIATFEKQHGRISIIKSNEFHDRFIILDNNEVYAFGGSLKDLGSKTTTVNKLEDPKICGELVSRIENISSGKMKQLKVQLHRQASHLLI